MKRCLLIIPALMVLLMPFATMAQEEAVEHSEENSYCFKCHGNATYSFYNDVSEKTITKRMNPYYVIDSNLYYKQNHKTFECIDCHSFDYKKFPHNRNLQMEPMPSCLDCHEGDDATARFNFEEINEEFKESVHSTKHSDAFSCYMCHSPHSYKFTERNSENIGDIIKYDNAICLSCHADIGKYQLISSQENPNIIKSHEWLPNQPSHFEHVRCIECHTDRNEDLMVAHKILPKKYAVKECVKCHSRNSILMASLYKFQTKEGRKLGFFNSTMLSSSTYVIGANRNYYLNVASWLIFSLVVLVILIHLVIKILSK